MTDSWRSPENVTVSSVRSVCSVRTVKPRVGTADTRHTSSSAKRTEAWPPADSMVCTPEPPSRQSVAPVSGREEPLSGGALVGFGAGFGGASVALGDDVVGVGVLERVGVGSGVLLGPGERLVAEANTVGAERATRGAGLVDPTTKWTVSTTAVTLMAVHESHMSR